MSVSSRPKGLFLAIATSVVLAGGVLTAPAAVAAGYPTLAACQQAGQAGVQAGYWEFYRCVPYRGRWELLPE